MTPHPITRDQFRFWKKIEVRWGDMDAQGHVNNTVYFTYCESARIELLRKIGFKGKQAGSRYGPTLVHASCDFRKQVVFPAMIDVGVRVEKISQRSIQLGYGFFRHGTDELVTSAISVNAWIDYEAERAVEIPDEFRAALASYQ